MADNKILTADTRGANQSDPVTGTSSGDKRGLDTYNLSSSVLDSSNTTTTPLANGEIFYGPWTKRTAPTMIMAPYADQDFFWYAQFATTELSTTLGQPVYTAGSAGGIDSSIPYSYEVGVVRIPERLVIAREWYRIVIVNNSGTDMTELRFQTSVGDYPKLETNREDTGNSLKAPLGADEVFTGFGTDLLGTQQINTTIVADQDSAPNGLEFQFSANGTDWETFRTFTYTANSFRTFQWGPYARYYRVKFTNGSTAQTSVLFQTLLLPTQSLTTIHRAGDVITDDRTVTLNKSITTGLKPDGLYGNARVGGPYIPSNPAVSPLGAGGSYTSEWIKTAGYVSIAVLINSDQVSATGGIMLEFSEDDGTGNAPTGTVRTRITRTFNAGDASNQWKFFPASNRSDWVRFKYQNGGIAQTLFFVELRFNPTQIEFEGDSIEADIDSNQIGIITRNLIFGYNGSTYGNIGRGSAGGLDTGIIQHEVATPILSLTGFSTNSATVTTTATQIAAGRASNAKAISIKANPSNSKTIYIGANASVTSGNGYPLDAGDSIDLDIDETQSIYVITATGTEQVHWLILTGSDVS